MANYLDAPLVPILFLRPKRASYTQIGAGVDGGVNIFGEGIESNLGGAARVKCTYEECVLERDDTERHEIIEWLGARGQGGTSFFAVPIINDQFGPFPIIGGFRRPIISGIPHSDGSLFSDGAGYSQATVWGVIAENAAGGAGILKVQVFGAARPLRWAGWFSILHPTKGWRAYRYWDILDKTDEESPIYTLAIKAALKEAVSVGDRVELARPTCVMKFAKDQAPPSEISGWYSARPTLNFIEAF